ncbi:hypothetical protein ME802_12340 [Lactobacillus delbrueckii]|nr:hypothetical protein ME802_12340 [Lactobacillus delbrueckii]
MKKAGDINMRRQFLDEQSYHWIGRFLPFWLLTLLVTPFFHQAWLYYALEDIGDLLLLFWLIAWSTFLLGNDSIPVFFERAKPICKNSMIREP